MKCMQCGSAMTTKRENVPYTALPGTVLVGVEVSRCPNCGEFEVAIPAVDELNRVLAEAVIHKKARLTGAEIRFLRSYIGYSAVDFGKAIGSNPATVSRWESDKQPIGHHADLLLRAMVAIGMKADDYGLDEIKQISLVAAESETPKTKAKSAKPFYPYEFASSAKKWKPSKSVQMSN